MAAEFSYLPTDWMDNTLERHIHSEERQLHRLLQPLSFYFEARDSKTNGGHQHTASAQKAHMLSQIITTQKHFMLKQLLLILST